jgi:hypothetical protein
MRSLTLGSACLVWVLAACGGSPAGSETVIANAPPPDDPSALLDWLDGGGHSEWRSTQVFPTGDFGGAKIFFNDALEDSYAEARDAHPVGSAAVRELYEDDLTSLRGYGLIRKTRDGASDPSAWFWYEAFDTPTGWSPLVAEHAAPGCTGCHAEGRDFVQSHWPLGSVPPGPS